MITVFRKIAISKVSRGITLNIYHTHPLSESTVSDTKTEGKYNNANQLAKGHGNQHENTGLGLLGIQKNNKNLVEVQVLEKNGIILINANNNSKNKKNFDTAMHTIVHTHICSNTYNTLIKVI